MKYPLACRIPAAKLLTLILLFPLLAGCRGQLPAHWQQEAVRVSTSKFTIETDLPRERAESILSDLNHAYEEYLQHFSYDQSNIADSLKVTVLRSLFDFSDYTGVSSPDLEKAKKLIRYMKNKGIKTFSYKLNGPPRGGQYRPGKKEIILYDHEGKLSSLRHELAHWFIDHRDRPKRWFNEGVAEYLNHLHDVNHSLQKLTDIKTALDSDSPGSSLKKIIRKTYLMSDPLDYAKTWMLTYYMIEIEESVKLSDYTGYQQSAQKILGKKTASSILNEVHMHLLRRQEKLKKNDLAPEEAYKSP